VEEGNMGRSHTLASEYADLESEMSGVRNGTQLREAVANVLHQLPKGPLAIFSTSDEGAGIAAAAAASRGRNTFWRRISLASPPIPPEGYRVVIVEPVDPGRAWLSVAVSRFPGVSVIIARNGDHPR
jgi:hypothetical protein